MLVPPLTGNKKRPERAQVSCAPVETLERIISRPPLGPSITPSGSTEFSLQYIQSRARVKNHGYAFGPRGPLSYHYDAYVRQIQKRLAVWSGGVVGNIRDHLTRLTANTLNLHGITAFHLHFE